MYFIYRHKEIEDKVEREKILRELRDLETDKIKLIEKNKQEELNKLEQQKKQLKIKQIEIVKNVEKLSQKMKGKTY